MVKIVIINEVYEFGSTGKIIADLYKKFKSDGHEVYVAYGRRKLATDNADLYYIGNNLNLFTHAILSRLFDLHGVGSYYSTKKFLKFLDKINPELIWLHNIHGYYLNYPLLFKWIKEHPNIEVKWTLHDCWSFTGHCTHFSKIKCNKWIKGCYKCPQKQVYPKTLVLSLAKTNYELKKDNFTNVKNMTIYVPSKWLKGLVEQSFLKNYRVIVQPNKIDNSIFYEREKDYLKKAFNLGDKKTLLGVSSVWSENKGLSKFIELSKIISNNYQIVLVGLNEKQQKQAPSNIICLNRTSDMDELAKIYSSSDIYLNLSSEETFGMTTVEAAYCGCKIIVLKNTACEEIAKEYDGLVVENNVEDIYKAILAID